MLSVYSAIDIQNRHLEARCRFFKLNLLNLLFSFFIIRLNQKHNLRNTVILNV